ncbi:lycopene beta-cyclase CrtY [Novosphingobium sp. YJ-S2-02]|uniref:Lycopene beta-cyclase CrtY n=2 Tax=Novosphingobium aureum TaxID=2792964 RepID=A0A931HDW2_9SPHN|nr:lycopene beta-cyclase CrtY [Novosphingobium aureum]
MSGKNPDPCAGAMPALIVVGGGLAGALITLAMARWRPELRVELIEAGERIGGEHVWSFFASDVDEAHRALVEPLIASRWDGYDVTFPGYTRSLSTAYASVTSASLDAAIRDALPASALHTGVKVRALGTTWVELEDGTRREAGGVIDARGSHGLAHMAGGWQKFMGQTLRLAAPHGLTRPVVMDARVEQLDGYRFVYCLPFSQTQVFVEDTYYSDDPGLDLPVLRERIGAYAKARGWQVEAVDYEETGVLPVIARGDFARFWQGDVARAGVRAALVQPLTSYSLPDAVRFAAHLTTLDNLSGERLGRTSHDWAANHWREGRFYRMLSTMLFGAAPPQERWRMLARFYKLPEPLIERFYAGRSTLADMARVLVGKPPVPIGAAVAALAGRGRVLADLDPRGAGEVA